MEHDNDYRAPNDVDNAAGQRKALVAFATAIGARTKLGADEAGNPRLEGRAGRVYVQPATAAREKPIYQLFCFDGRQRLKNTKQALGGFMKLTNGGYDDCLFAIVGVPRPAFAETIRDRLVIAKRKEYDEATLARMRDRMAGIRSSAEAQQLAA